MPILFFTWPLCPVTTRNWKPRAKIFFLQVSAGEQDVDMVITTRECLQLIQESLQLEEEKANLLDCLSSQPPAPTYFGMEQFLASSSSSSSQCALIVSPNNQSKECSARTSESAQFFPFSSGGYAAFIFRYAAQDLFGVDLWDDGPLDWQPIAYNEKSQVSARVAHQRRDYYQIILYRHPDGSYSTTNTTYSLVPPRGKWPPWAWGKTASYPSAWQAGKVDLMPLVARQLLLSDWVARQGLKTAGRRIHGSPWSSEASTWCPVQVLRVSKPPDMRCTFPSWCEEIVLEPPTLGLNPPFYPNGVIMTAWANHLRP